PARSGRCPQEGCERASQTAPRSVPMRHRWAAPGGAVSERCEPSCDKRASPVPARGLALTEPPPYNLYTNHLYAKYTFLHAGFQDQDGEEGTAGGKTGAASI